MTVSVGYCAPISWELPSRSLNPKRMRDCASTRKDTDRNYWMSASEAIDYGVANKIISSIKDLK